MEYNPEKKLLIGEIFGAIVLLFILVGGMLYVVGPTTRTHQAPAEVTMTPVQKLQTEVTEAQAALKEAETKVSRAYRELEARREKVSLHEIPPEEAEGIKMKVFQEDLAKAQAEVVTAKDRLEKAKVALEVAGRGRHL